MAGLSFADPFLEKNALSPEPNPYAPNSPTSNMGIDGLAPSAADMAAMGQQLVKQSQFTMPAIKRPPTIAVSQSTNKFFVNGITFDADDATAALESEQYLSNPSTGLPTQGDWTPIDQQSYSQFLASIRDPSLKRLASKNFDLGVDNMQMLAGRGLQFLGAEQTGQNIVDNQVRDIEKKAPFSREFSNIQSGDDAIDWFVANLAQQGPNMLESIVVGAGGFLAGTAVGGPGAGVVAGVAGILGKAAVKKSILDAAKKRAAGGVLTAAETRVLRNATGTFGAAAASLASNLATGTADIYGEMREQGVGADDNNARMMALLGAIPYAGLEFMGEFALASRIFGGIKGTGRDLASIKGSTALRTGALRGGELLKRAGAGIAVGGTLEGTTELGQEALVLGLSGQDLTTEESQKRMLEAFAAGFGVGGAIGGAANLRRGNTPITNQPTNLLSEAQPTEPSTALTITEPTAGQPTGPVTQGGMMGRPDFVGGSDGTTRASRPSDTIYTGEVAPGMVGEQGVLDIFGPQGATIAELQQRSRVQDPLLQLPAPTPTIPAGQGALQFAPPPPPATPSNTPPSAMQIAMQHAESVRAMEQRTQDLSTQREADNNRLAIQAQNQRLLDFATPPPAPVAEMPMRAVPKPNPQQLKLFGRGQLPKPSAMERVRKGIPFKSPRALAPVTVVSPQVDLRRSRQLSLFTQDGTPTLPALRAAGIKQPYVPVPKVGGSQIPPTGRVVNVLTVAKALAEVNRRKGTGAKLKAKEASAGLGSAKEYLDDSKYFYHAVRDDEDIAGITSKGLRPSTNVGTTKGQSFGEGETVLVFRRVDYTLSKKLYQDDEIVVSGNAAPVAILKDYSSAVNKTSGNDAANDKLADAYDVLEKRAALLAKELNITTDKFWSISRGRDRSALGIYADEARAMERQQNQIFNQTDKIQDSEEKGNVSKKDVLNRYSKHNLPVYGFKTTYNEKTGESGITPDKDPTPPKGTALLKKKIEPKAATTVAKAQPAVVPAGAQKLQVKVAEKVQPVVAEKGRGTGAKIVQRALAVGEPVPNASIVEQLTGTYKGKPDPVKSGEIGAETILENAFIGERIETAETTKSTKQYELAMYDIVEVYVTGNNKDSKVYKLASDFLFTSGTIPESEFVKALRNYAGIQKSISTKSKLYTLLRDFNLLNDPKIEVRVTSKLEGATAVGSTQADVDIGPDQNAVRLADLINNRDGWPNKKQLVERATTLFKLVDDTEFSVGQRGVISDFFTDGKPIVMQIIGTNKFVLSSNVTATKSREEFAAAHAQERKAMRALEDEYADEDKATGLREQFLNNDFLIADDESPNDFSANKGKANFFRTDEKPSAPMKAGALNLLVKKFVSKLARKSNVHVYANLEDLRKSNYKLFKEAAKARQAGDFEAVNAAGMAWGNHVILFADNINGVQHANFILAHEILGHVGFRGLFSDAQLNKILQVIVDSDAQVSNAALVYSEAKGIPFLEAVEEVLSDRAAAIDSNTVMRFWAWLKNQLNKLGFKFDDDAARYLISLSRKYIRQGVGRSEVNLNTFLQGAATARELDRSDIEVLRFSQHAPQGQQTAAMNAMNQNAAMSGGFVKAFEYLSSADDKMVALRTKLDGKKLNFGDTMQNFFGLLRTQDDMARDSKGMAAVFNLTQRKGEMQQKLKTKYSKLTEIAHQMKFLMFGEKGPEPVESVQAGQLLALGSLLRAKSYTDAQLDSRFPSPVIYSVELGHVIVKWKAFQELSNTGLVSVEEFKKGFDVQLGFTEKSMTAEHIKELEKMRDVELKDMREKKDRELARMKIMLDRTESAKDKTAMQATIDKTEGYYDTMIRSTEIAYTKQLGSSTFNAPNMVSVKDMAEFAWVKDLTADSIQYKMYLQFREAINRSQIDVLAAKYNGAIYEQNRALQRGVGRAFNKSLTEAETRFLSVVSETYDQMVMEGASYENNRLKMSKASADNAENFIHKKFGRAFYSDLALADVSKMVQGYTAAEVEQLIKAMRVKLETKVDPEVDNVNDSSIWSVVYAIEERSSFTIALNDDALYAKRSIAGGYTPLARRGDFQVRMQAYIINADGKEVPVKLHQGQQDSLPLFMTEKKDEAIGYAEELKILLGGEYTMRDDKNNVQPVFLKAIVSDIETTPALVDIMHYDDVLYALSRLGVNMPVADRELLIKKVTSQNSRARANLQRGGVPGWDKDIVRSASAFLEQQAYVASSKTFRHQFDGVLEDKKMWFGDRDKLAELKAKFEVATGPAKELAAREYYQEKYYFTKANEMVGKTNVERGKWYKERAKSQIDWQDSTGDIVFADDFWNNNQFSLATRTWAAVAQLGGSIATGITQMLSLPTNSWAYLSSYNPENNFGVGLGAARAGKLLTHFAYAVGAPKYSKVEFIQAELDALNASGGTESKDGLTASELRFLLDLTEEQRLDAASYNAMTGTVRGRTGAMGNPTFQKFIQTWMFPFSYSEQFNRRVTVLATYRGVYEMHIAAGISHTKADDAARIASEKSLDATQGDYAQYNRPSFFRGGVMAFVYMYKQYPIMMLQLLKNMDRKGQIVMLGSLIMLSGIRGLPGADDILDIVDGIMQRLGLQSGSVEKEFARILRDSLGDEMGATLTPVMMRGLLDATTGWSFSNRLSLGDIMPGTSLLKPSSSAQEKLREVENLAGAPVSFLVGVFDWAAGTIPAVVTGRQPVGNILTNAPFRAVKNAADAWKYANTGAILDSKGYVVAQDVSAWEIVGKAVGFYPSRAQVQMDWMMADSQEQRYGQMIKAEAIKEGVAAKLEGNTERLANVQKYVQNWNEDVKGTRLEIKNFNGGLSRAYKEASKPLAARALKSSAKAGRKEAEELAALYGFEVK